MVYKSIAAKRKERQASLIFTGSHVEEKGWIKKGKNGCAHAFFIFVMLLEPCNMLMKAGRTGQQFSLHRTSLPYMSDHTF